MTEAERAEIRRAIKIGEFLDSLERHAAEPPYGPMCRNPELCAGKGYCPRDPTCGG